LDFASSTARRPRDKVLKIAFAVCAAFLFGDHLAFTANFQPTLLVAVMLGKFGGGVAGFLLARWLSLPKALQIEKQQLAEQTAAGMRTNECTSMN
jgi:ethanolamine transporter